MLVNTTKKKSVEKKALVKLDIGSGPNPKEGFEGVDIIKFEKVKHVYDVRKTPWPWADSSVEEVHTSHFIEHLTADERIGFMNELYRVLIPGGKATIIAPHWASNRAYGDPTHKWPPVSEMWFYYLLKEWRSKEAPHTDADHMKGGYSCDFDAQWGYAMHQGILSRNTEYQQYAISWYKDAILDIHATLTSRKK